jgi:polyisoprenoid-binding protein YceI
MKAYYLVLALALAGSVAAMADDRPPGTIRFSARMKTLGESGGEFTRWRMDHAVIDEAHPERSEVDVTIDLASLDTGIPERDRHLRDERFFDVERFPTASVTLRHVRLVDEEHFTADVTLTLHGTTQTFPMDFRIEDRAARRVTGEVRVSRTAYGVGPALGWWSPLQIQDGVSVTVDVTVPPSTP